MSLGRGKSLGLVCAGGGSEWVGVVSRVGCGVYSEPGFVIADICAVVPVSDFGDFVCL